MSRRRVTPEAQARVDRIVAALSGLLEDDEPTAEAPVASREGGDPYRPVPAAPTVRKSKGALACPRCDGELLLHYSCGASIHRCADCLGLWLGPEDLDTMVEPPSDETKRSPEAIRRQVHAIAPPAADVRYRSCPRCQTPMNRRNFGDVSGVIVDECTEHGLFLDPGEFEAIETFIRLGGLSVQRRALKDRKRMAARREESRRASRAAMSAASLADSQVRRWWQVLLY